MGTSVGSITIRQAILIAMVFEFLGAPKRASEARNGGTRKVPPFSRL